MLDIPPKYIVSGSGLLDFTKKLVEKGTKVEKKVINSTASQDVVVSLLKKNSKNTFIRKQKK